MKFTPLALSLFLSVSAAAQAPVSGDALIDSRQAEVSQLALLNYNFHVAPGAWTHRQVYLCPAFDDLVFARYDHTSKSGTVASFFAIYNPAIPPARSLDKPWQGGILLLPLNGISKDPEPVISRKETLTTFNHLWLNELKRTPHLSADILAACYIHLADAQDMLASPPSSDTPAPPPGSPPIHVDSLLIPLQPNGVKPRSLYLKIDSANLIESVEVEE